VKVTVIMADWLGLQGARVLVAGAGGLGSATVDGFLGVGARVAVTDRDEGRLKDLAERTGLPGEVLMQADLTDPGAAADVVKQATAALGGLDVAVHSVGVNDRRPILELAAGDWSRILQVNLDTAFYLAQAAGRVMCDQRSGRIVLFSSVSGTLAHRNHGPYAASKGGINQMMRVMAHEWAAYGVSVNAVAPGYVETPLTAAHLAKPGVREDLIASVPAGDLSRPEDVVGPVLFLASPQARFVTGHVLYVDGGRTLV
jgi:gluconate 5-dehydrogenase